MNRTIELIVAPDGQTRITTIGYAGAACLQASKALEVALGQKTSEELTSEFHLAPLAGGNECRLEQSS